ncbi:hypothetical protein ACSFA7_14070 [Variovorax sp. LT1R20]|uniref:hypothetical protein n=1 Tax=Variovorax sp. LT1R20 TaxID=3443729 RepID=UPI003F48D5C7
MPTLKYSSLFQAVIGSRLHDCEFVVFFDCPLGEAPAPHVEDLVSAVWHVDASDLDIYNVRSERELVEQAIAEADAGDLRLFEVGAYQGRPMFADPSRTLMLVHPSTQMRLTSAQILVPSVACTEEAAA